MTAKVFSADQLRKRVLRIKSLASMPPVVWELIDALGDDMVTTTRLETIIESDPALASKVLSLANSAYYGFAQQISTISRAVVAIGFEELQLLALGAGLSEMLVLEDKPRELDVEGVWLHSLAVAWFSRRLAMAAGHPNPGEVMVGGLLHDLGKLALAQYLDTEARALADELARGASYFEAEKKLGLEHAALGSWLGEKWGLAPVLVESIALHHAPPSRWQWPENTSLVVLGDEMIKRLGLGACHASAPRDVAKAMEYNRLSSLAVRRSADLARRDLPGILRAWRQRLREERQ